MYNTLKEQYRYGSVEVYRQVYTVNKLGIMEVQYCNTLRLTGYDMIEIFMPGTDRYRYTLCGMYTLCSNNFSPHLSTRL